MTAHSIWANVFRLLGEVMATISSRKARLCFAFSIGLSLSPRSRSRAAWASLMVCLWLNSEHRSHDLESAAHSTWVPVDGIGPAVLMTFPEDILPCAHGTSYPPKRYGPSPRGWWDRRSIFPPTFWISPDRGCRRRASVVINTSSDLRLLKLIH